MQIVLNGHPRTAPDPCSVRDLLNSLGLDGSRVAVELDGSIVSRADWDSVRLREGSNVEVVHFVGGGSTKKRLTPARFFV